MASELNDELKKLQKSLVANGGWLPGLPGSIDHEDETSTFVLADDDGGYVAPFDLSDEMGSMLADDDDDGAPIDLSDEMGSMLADDEDSEAPDDATTIEFDSGGGDMSNSDGDGGTESE